MEITTTRKSRRSRAFTIIGSTLLIFMAFFHGSGFYYVTDQIQQSNATSILKEIFPILFIHPSIHLLGLAALGILTLFMRQESNNILFFISALIFIDSLISFYLEAFIPGVLLLIAIFFFILSLIPKKA